MEHGVIKWFNERKGYGFIQKESGDDIFVHYSGIVSEGIKNLLEGDKVEFDIEETEKGPRAISVKKI